MGGLHDAVVRYYDLGGVCYCLLVATWGIYTDVVLSCPCVRYDIFF